MLATARVFALLGAVSLALSAQAANPVAERWAKKLDESSAALKSGQHARSLKIANGLIRDMFEQLGPGDAATKFFALAVTHKALAHAGLGQNEDALWYWHVAVSLHPPFAKSDLSEFGEAGKFLVDHRELRRKTAIEAWSGERPSKDITPPRLIKRVEPKFPRGAQYFGTSGIVVVEVVLAKDGTISSPRIEKTLPAPTLAWATLEAVRQWKLEPGKIDGQPVDVIFNLTVNYKL